MTDHILHIRDITTTSACNSIRIPWAEGSAGLAGDFDPKVGQTGDLHRVSKKFPPLNSL